MRKYWQDMGSSGNHNSLQDIKFFKDLDKINQSDRLVKPIKNLHIIQSSSDEVNDTSMFNLLQSSKFNTYQLPNSSHFPLFEFDQIYEIIKNIK